MVDELTTKTNTQKPSQNETSERNEVRTKRRDRGRMASALMARCVPPRVRQSRPTGDGVWRMVWRDSPRKIRARGMGWRAPPATHRIGLEGSTGKHGMSQQIPENNGQPTPIPPCVCASPQRGLGGAQAHQKPANRSSARDRVTATQSPAGRRNAVPVPILFLTLFLNENAIFQGVFVVGGWW